MNWICFLGTEIKRISPDLRDSESPVHKQQIQNDRW